MALTTWLVYFLKMLSRLRLKYTLFDPRDLHNNTSSIIEWHNSLYQMYDDTAHCKTNLIIYWTLRLRYSRYHEGFLEISREYIKSEY